MPIDPSIPPQAAVAAVERAMSARAARSMFSTSKLRRANVRTLERSTPHRVAYLSLDQIRDGHNLRQATQPGGWRFLIHDGPSEAIAAARVVIKDAGQYDLGELSEGAFVTGTENSIRFAEGLQPVRSGRFEAVLLMVPEIQVVALWLQDLAGDADLVLPITTSPRTDSERISPEMTSAAFVKKIQGVAETVRRKRTGTGDPARQ